MALGGSGYLAIVTGGAQGIGLAITSALLEAGAKVHFLDVSIEAGMKAQQELDEKYGSGKATFVQCDVTRKDELEKAFREAKENLGGLNVVCNNAGISLSAERTCWEEIIAVNLSAAIHGTMLAQDLMEKSKGGNGGVIVNTSSTLVFEPLGSLINVYRATKSGILEYSRCRALTSIAEGVRINCICPHLTATKMLDGLIQGMKEANMFETDQMPVTEDDFKALILSPSQIAEGVMTLIKDETKNGESLVVSKLKGSYFHKFN